ncbi:hypothetical protein V6N13_107461 [Hibiscus sabdariffa]
MEEKKAKTVKEKKKEGLMLRMGRRAVENLRSGRRPVKKFRATEWQQLMLPLPRKFMIPFFFGLHVFVPYSCLLLLQVAAIGESMDINTLLHLVCGRWPLPQSNLVQKYLNGWWNGVWCINKGSPWMENLCISSSYGYLPPALVYFRSLYLTLFHRTSHPTNHSSYDEIRVGITVELTTYVTRTQM